MMCCHDKDCMLAMSWNPLSALVKANITWKYHDLASQRFRLLSVGLPRSSYHHAILGRENKAKEFFIIKRQYHHQSVKIFPYALKQDEIQIT